MKIAALLILPILVISCVTREEINADIWNNNFNADELKELCTREPILKQIGFYRKLNNGKIEVVSICKDGASKFFSITDKDLKELLDKALPKQQPEAN